VRATTKMSAKHELEMKLVELRTKNDRLTSAIHDGQWWLIR
jgi:hypothetical protein